MPASRTVAADGHAALRRPGRRSLSDSVAEAIADGIANGHLVPGDRVIETSIAAQLDVSRVPVREALKILHAQGVLDGEAHKGYRVVSFGSGSVHQLLEIRIELETMLLRDALAAWRVDPRGAAVLERPLTDMRRAAVAQDVTGVLKADLDFHRTICDAADNHIARTLWQTIARHVLIVFCLEQRHVDELPAVVGQHEDLLAFIARQLRAKRGEAGIRKVMEDHILAVARRREARRD